MTKMIKLSLAAAVAVAGFTTTASAGNLSEMIQGVQTSGFVRYRDTDTDTDGTNDNDTNAHEYKIVLDNKIKVNDSVTANIKAVMVTGKTNINNVAFDTNKTTTQADHDFDITRANFIYTGIANTTVTYGIQGYNVPLTNDSEAQGLKIATNVGGVTLIGAAFNSDLNDADSELAVLAAVAPVGPVTITALQANNKTGTNNDKDKYTYLNAKAKIANVAVSVTSVDVDYEAAATNDEGMDFITASTNLAGFGVTLGYANTDKNGGDVFLADGGAGDRTASQFALIQASAGGFADADVTLVSVSKKVGPVALTLAQADADASAANADAKETVFKAAYAMSKNFKVSGWVSKLDYENVATGDDNTKTRLEVKYSF
jgi:hypothetical protein